MSFELIHQQMQRLGVDKLQEQKGAMERDRAVHIDYLIKNLGFTDAEATELVQKRIDLTETQIKQLVEESESLANANFYREDDPRNDVDNFIKVLDVISNLPEKDSYPDRDKVLQEMKTAGIVDDSIINKINLYSDAFRFCLKFFFDALLSLNPKRIENFEELGQGIDSIAMKVEFIQADGNKQTKVIKIPNHRKNRDGIEQLTYVETINRTVGSKYIPGIDHRTYMHASGEDFIITIQDFIQNPDGFSYEAVPQRVMNSLALDLTRSSLLGFIPDSNSHVDYFKGPLRYDGKMERVVCIDLGGESFFTPENRELARNALNQGDNPLVLLDEQLESLQSLPLDEVKKQLGTMRVSSDSRSLLQMAVHDYGQLLDFFQNKLTIEQVNNSETRRFLTFLSDIIPFTQYQSIQQLYEEVIAEGI